MKTWLSVPFHQHARAQAADLRVTGLASIPATPAALADTPPWEA